MTVELRNDQGRAHRGRRHGRRQADSQPGEQVVTVGQLRLGARARKVSDRQRADGSRHEHLRALRPPPGHDRAGHDRHPDLRHRRLPAAAGDRAAQRRLSDDPGVGAAARREPRDDGLGGRDAAREAVLDDRRHRLDDVGSRPTGIATITHAVLARPQHRRRGAGRAVGDRRRGARSCRRRCPRRRRSARSIPADAPIMLHRAHRRRRCRCRPSTSTPRPCWRSASRRSAASRRCRCTARRSTRCASSSTRTRWPRAASARRGRAGASATATSTCRPARSTARDRATSVQATGQLDERGGLRAADRRLSQRRAGAPERARPRHRQRAERQDRRLVQRHARHRARDAAPARHQHDRGRRRDHASSCRRSGRSCRRRSSSTSSTTARESIRAVGARRAVHAAARAGAGGRGDLPVPAQRLGDAHPEPGAADVDHRHVRRSCTCSATASTTCR